MFYIFMICLYTFNVVVQTYTTFKDFWEHKKVSCLVHFVFLLGYIAILIALLNTTFVAK